MPRGRQVLLILVGTILLGLFSLPACNTDDDKLLFERKGRTVPAFSADSAYHYIEKQVELGPRNPGSRGHQRARDYLFNKLVSLAGSSYVYQQNFIHEGYEQDTLQLTNIVASFNPAARDRIMLCAHWDTRPRADRADKRRLQPILGANDGGSGVAVLLEMARLFSQHEPPLGVDIVLFDGEDYGKSGDPGHYFLGSRYWANHPPVDGYQPRFGILLDMVGGTNAQFLKEQYSLTYAPALVDEIWSIAEQKGFSSLFPDRQGARISDDHVIINQILNFPAINIIDHRVKTDGSAEFPPYWHTHRDRLDIIDKRTLKGVGSLLTELIYNRL